MTTKRVRGFCFTINFRRGPIPGNIDELLQQLCEMKPDTCVVGQLEQGEREQTVHLQGCIHWKHPITFATMKRRLHDVFGIAAHIEEMQGRWDQARDYCTKADTRVEGPWIHGEEPKQGDRTDLRRIAQLFMNPELSLIEKVMQEPSAFLKYGRNCQNLHEMFAPTRKPGDPMTVILLTGPTGTGKTTYAANVLAAYYQDQGFKGVYEKTDSTKWWSFYRGEEIAIINEFDGSIGRPTDLNRWWDPAAGAATFESKGGHQGSNIKVWIITSNGIPATWYKWDEIRNSPQASVERRIHYYGVFGDNGTYRPSIWMNWKSEPIDGPIPAGWVPDPDPVAVPGEQLPDLPDGPAEDDGQGPQPPLDVRITSDEEIENRALDQEIVPATPPLPSIDEEELFRGQDEIPDSMEDFEYEVSPPAPRRRKKRRLGMKGASRFIDDQAGCDDTDSDDDEDDSIEDSSVDSWMESD